MVLVLVVLVLWVVNQMAVTAAAVAAAAVASKVVVFIAIKLHVQPTANSNRRNSAFSFLSPFFHRYLLRVEIIYFKSSVRSSARASEQFAFSKCSFLFYRILFLMVLMVFFPLLFFLLFPLIWLFFFRCCCCFCVSLIWSYI